MELPSQKKIAFILGSMGRGGAERVISILSKNFAKCGWLTNICLLLFNKVDYSLDPTTRVFDFTGSVLSRLKRAPYWLRTLRSYIKREQPDVVVSFAARINILVLLASLGTKTKVIISERNDPSCDGRGIITKFFVRLLYPISKRIVFQTTRSLNYFPKSILKKGIVIPNPICVDCFASEVKKKKIVSVGRLTKQKNHALLIRSFAEVSKDFPEYELFIYGDGELLNELKMLSVNLEIDSKVHFEGNVPNLHEQIADAELFVLSSNYEGLSNALLEALMMGLPCISTNCAGSDEYIKNGVNGFIVPVNDIEKLQKAMKQILSDNMLKEKFSKQAKISSKKFTEKNVFFQWQQVIGEKK